MSDDKLDTWGGITEYVVDDGDLLRCYAYHLFGDEWTRIELQENERERFDSTDDVPDGWTLVGVAENHPMPNNPNAETEDRIVVAVFAPFHGHEWGTVELRRAGDE